MVGLRDAEEKGVLDINMMVVIFGIYLYDLY
jgi:hypothetical protein